MYNILYVGNFHPLSVGEPEIARAFEKLGHRVKQIDVFNTDMRYIRKALLNDKYDFLLFAKFNIGVGTEIKEFLQRECNIPSVCWLFDLYWGYAREKKNLEDTCPAFYANIVFTTDGGNEAKWKQYKVKHYCLRQGIDENVKIGNPKKDLLNNVDIPVEIAFIGTRVTWSGWAWRGILLDFLHKTYGRRFKHFGEGGNIRHERLDNLIASLKIVIGDTVVSPYYWSNRVYEMLGRGAFLMHPKVPGLEKEFQYYKHFIPFDLNLNQIKEKIDYFLEHEEKREIIKKAGFEFVHKNYTYTHRAKELLKILEKEKII